jgi:hypothetical protein
MRSCNRQPDKYPGTRNAVRITTRTSVPTKGNLINQIVVNTRFRERQLEIDTRIFVFPRPSRSLLEFETQPLPLHICSKTPHRQHSNFFIYCTCKFFSREKNNYPRSSKKITPGQQK